MPTRRCPVCKKPLSEREYERALGILGERERHFHEQEAHFKEREAKLKEKARDANGRARTARSAGIKAGKAYAQRLLQGKDQVIGRLQTKLKQLQKGSTPQTEGLEFEDKLEARLRREFPGDEVRRTPGSKNGDVLHTVRSDKKGVGLIVYECKQTRRIEDDHVDQALRAKRMREAEFAVIVTTGKRRGFTGLSNLRGILVVSPLGVVALATLLRQVLLEMFRARIGSQRRSQIAGELLKYVTSPQFKNPIEELVQRATDFQGLLPEEMKTHPRIWPKRWGPYQTNQWKTEHLPAKLPP